MQRGTRPVREHIAMKAVEVEWTLWTYHHIVMVAILVHNQAFMTKPRH